MKFKRIGADQYSSSDKFVLEMDFYEANDLLCMILPAAEKSNIETFKADAKAQNGYVRGDKIRIRKIRKLMSNIQTTFNDMWKED
jgi:hypothetical protein